MTFYFKPNVLGNTSRTCDCNTSRVDNTSRARDLPNRLKSAELKELTYERRAYKYYRKLTCFLDVCLILAIARKELVIKRLGLTQRGKAPLGYAGTKISGRIRTVPIRVLQNISRNVYYSSLTQMLQSVYVIVVVYFNSYTV